ncbi:MAG: ferrous iron transport protein A [Pirellulaceae bacterium]|jgi:ferrous iron transport protein A|nr:ferrous iron transport protein A [Pirellulaceae bacterium]
MSSPTLLTLADIAPGQTATISEVIGDDAIAVRLMEMGLTDGETVRVVGRAPLGDPIELSIRGYKLSLRKLEAARVRVQAQKASDVT